MKLLRPFLILAMLVGPAAAEQASHSATEITAAEASRWLAFFDKLVVAVVKTESSPCEKMAASVSAVIDKNRDAIEAARTAHQQGKTLPEDAQKKMLEGVKKMVPGIQRCGSNEKVRAAFGKLDLSRDDE